jgi:transposase-like protein
LKAQILAELQVPGTKLSHGAKKYGIPENTLRDWTKASAVQSIEVARQRHGGTLKANIFDPLNRLTESLMVFFDRNNAAPEDLRIPLTTKLVVAKGLEARNNLLELHEIQPFLDEAKEKKAIESFKGASWVK